MSTTVIGVFVRSSHVREARRHLGVAGIGPSGIRSSLGAWAGVACVDAEHERSAIGGFFLHLLCRRNAGVAQSSEAARRSHLVLTVDVAEAHRVDEIGDILETCGAVDVDDRFGGTPVPAAGGGDLAPQTSGGRRDYVRRTEFDGVAIDALPHVRMNAGVERRARTGAYGGLERRARA